MITIHTFTVEVMAFAYESMTADDKYNYVMRYGEDDPEPLIDLLGVQSSSDVLAVVTLDATGDVPVRSPLTQNEAEAEIKSAYENLAERSTDFEEYWQGYIDAALGLCGLDIDFDGNVKTSELFPLKQMELTIEEEDRVRELDLRWDAFRAGMTFAERHGEEEAE